ncbi:MAG: formylglycine-generating enzyme family protein [Kofleriaceae bacterium]
MKRMVVLVLAACGSPPATSHPNATKAPLSSAADERMVTIPEGQYIAGSTPEERVSAYDDFLATANRDTAREQTWFATEADRTMKKLPAFRIDLMPVTQAAYAEFVGLGLAPAPAMDEATWKAQGFAQDYATQVARFVWHDNRPPNGREDHPVVLVAYADAKHYCEWRGGTVGQKRRLPTSDEYEKAARGGDGFTYPWGNAYEATKLNSAVAGPGDTTPVGQYSDGASPFGVLDLAGNVFAWTSTPAPKEPGEQTVKGSAWEDYAGVGRGASGHGRKPTVRHVIVGFRCASEP